MTELQAKVRRDQCIAQIADDDKAAPFQRQLDGHKLLLADIDRGIDLSGLKRPTQELVLAKLWRDDLIGATAFENLIDPLRSSLPVCDMEHRRLRGSSAVKGRRDGGIRRHSWLDDKRAQFEHPPKPPAVDGGRDALWRCVRCFNQADLAIAGQISKAIV